MEGVGSVDRRDELRAFLRSRRKQIHPSDVGLPERLGRREHGLRREDVAELAGLSLSWYARLELGLVEAIMPQTLAAVARALRLDSNETAYLFGLTRTPVPQATTIESCEVSPQLRALVKRFDAGSAVVYGPCFDVLLANPIAEWLGFRRAGEGLASNVPWQPFTQTIFRERFVEWEEMAGRTAAMLREAYGRHVGDPAFEKLIESLHTESDQFAAYWERQVVNPLSHWIVHVRVVDGEPIALGSTSTAVIGVPGQLLSFMVPLNEENVQRLRQAAKTQ
jgi:transcriptional regulator with XRE-family HTH domain